MNAEKPAAAAKKSHLASGTLATPGKRQGDAAAAKTATPLLPS